MNKLSILSVVRLILLTGLLSLFFACSNNGGSSINKPPSLQEFKGKEGDSKTDYDAKRRKQDDYLKWWLSGKKT